MENNYKEALISVRKELYKNNYKAQLQFIGKGIAYYKCDFLLAWFHVPVDDMGDADFFPEMEAKLLIRWIKLL
jgi:hypothetical protein